MQDTRNTSENESDKRCNEIWGQYTVVWSKGKLSIVFGSGSNQNHKYSCNNKMKHKTLVKSKADWPKIIPKSQNYGALIMWKGFDEMRQKKRCNRVHIQMW